MRDDFKRTCTSLHPLAILPVPCSTRENHLQPAKEEDDKETGSAETGGEAGEQSYKAD